MQEKVFCQKGRLDSLNIEISDLKILHDSTKKDISNDSLVNKNSKQRKRYLESEVKYNCRDSMRYELSDKKVYLYGDAKVEYEKFKLSANYIELDFNLSTAYARGETDSSGVLAGTPVFEDAGTSFNSKEMTYNFETKKGLIKEVITKQNDGYIHGERVKKMENEVVFIKNGKYTTCDQADPHFHLQVSKLKIIPNDKIITGPAYLKIADIPTPLALPFGFFPNKKGRASGILIPAPGQNQSLGFFLNNGGYYFGISDKMDLQLTADVYSKGSIAMRANSKYVQRYKHSGNLQVSYSYFQTGFKELGNKPRKDFAVRWTHNQDAKARPNTSFSGSINLMSNSFNRLNSPASVNYLNNTMQSNIAYGKSLDFMGLSSNLSLNASHSQNTINKQVSVTLPQVVFNVNRFYPFKKKIQVGAERAWEKIGISYVGNARNQINTYDSLINSDLINKMNHGITHGFVVSTSLKTNNEKWFRFLNNFTVTPSVNYTDRWYFQTIEKKFDNQKDVLVTDTVNGFKRIGESSYSAAITTKIYGMFQFKKSVIQAVRHVITPSLGFTYRPAVNSEKQIINNNKVVTYSAYDIGVFGRPSSMEQGNITYSIINNLEMKVKKRKDTVVEYEKVKLFENLSLIGSYNMLAKEFKWSLIRMNARTNLYSNIDLVGNATLDPYTVDKNNKRINVLQWDVDKKLTRLSDASLALNFRLNSKAKDKTKPNSANSYGVVNMNGNSNGMMEDYVDFDIPWNLNVYFNLNYYNNIPLLAANMPSSSNFTPSLTFNGDFSLTPKWKFGFNSGYDFVLKDLSYTTINLYRDLHCWELRVNMTPMGVNKSYMLTIGVKPGSLQDLKISRQLRPDYNNL